MCCFVRALCCCCCCCCCDRCWAYCVQCGEGERMCSLLMLSLRAAAVASPSWAVRTWTASPLSCAAERVGVVEG